MKDQELLQEIREHEVDGKLHWFEMNRRGFLQLLGGGLVICVAGAKAIAQESGRGFHGHELPKDLAAWLHIGEDGRITGFTGKVEIGQNIRTSLAQQIAEELRVPMESVTLLMGDTDHVPWDAGTFGSRTTPTMAPQMRAAAATARDVLVQLAAERWKQDPKTLVVAGGRITNPSTKQALSYGELTRGKNLMETIAADPPETIAPEWQFVGKPLTKANGREIVTGKHQYPADISRPGMLYGKVLRPEGFQAKLTKLDASGAEKVPAVRVVHDGDFVGVVAPDLSLAEQAVGALKAEWAVPEQPSNKNLFEYLMKNLDATQMSNEHVLGSVEKTLPSAEVKLDHSYTVQYIAHAPLEPRAAVAEWNGDHLTVWTGTQRPFAVRDQLADAFRIDSSQVRVLMPDTGSGYGGKHQGDAAVEAARLAKAAGKPVRLMWTREEEFTWAYFRPAGIIRVNAGAQRDGTLVSWEFHNYNSGPAAMKTPYEVPNQLIQFHPSKSPLRQGSYRGLAATANHFARESHMDAIAHEVQMDPLEFRLKNLKDERLRAVFQAAAERFGWGKEKASSERAFGIAGGIEKGGYVATCVELALNPKTKGFRIRRVVEAFDCGRVVNPNGLENQITGAIIQGLGGALFEQVKFEGGKILNAHFSEYRVPRFADVPEIEVVIVDRKDLPSAGAGETPIVGLAPAVANAVFAGVGVRPFNLPIGG
ncbi:MAG TPA: molybdopterin cofactor-binding domain-containing protein [Terriglobales bacterium]|nr:molybdopterin cofactor-binding domain-containing protein [Terriglobales bacterium]